ncbi:LacI family DNA-binding transcriptional regulator [Zobellia uliginosa]|uniref:LacI family DNA-binding transcriptional regulator n=1 Tax=Zobellia uliginosa TaxID=143224 RepID=UPI0026E2F2BF|nr:LacI family DNA-binding transcriptional regulator [Zobellia uliginosa]MDO6518725.1 LacI family DNA-binding transcriptional regulator [Zobellia uliginosa]
MKTIKDIAEEAKVSTGTVDRVIHNRPGVSPKTKERIQKLLDKYDFERNILASTLAFKKKYTIATLIPTPASKNQFWSGPNKGLKSAAKEIQKYGVITHRYYFDQYDLKSYERALEQILKLKPNGVVFAPFFYNTSLAFVEKLKTNDIPFVLINIDLETAYKLSYIGQDSFKSGYLCGKMMNIITAPKESIAILTSKKNVDSHLAIETRIKGFMNFFETNKNEKPIHKIFVESFAPKEVYKALTEEFSKPDHITGIFVPSSALFTVADFLQSENLQNIRTVGFDVHQKNLDYIRKGTIDFAIDQHPFEQGYMGVKILFEYLLLNKTPKPEYRSPMNIVTKENVDSFNVASAIEYSV